MNEEWKQSKEGQELCTCGHMRWEHFGIGGMYPGACNVCGNILKCSQFGLPIKKTG